MLKLSKYTLLQKDGKEYLLFNTFSKAFLGVSFSDAKQKDLMEILVNGGSISESDMPAGFNVLIDQGILTNLSPEEEDKLLENSYYSNYFSNDVATITLAPSLSCNLRCNYCYQSGYRQNSDTLSSGSTWDQDALEFIKKYIGSRKLKKVVFVWFGGEPLLAYRLLKNFSYGIKEYLAKDPLKIKFDIITNGTILNEDILSVFGDLPMETAQITIDGPEKSHDRMRPYVNGKGTYRDILKNIAEILHKTDTSVALRFNLSLENSALKYFTGLVSEMKKSFGSYVQSRRLRLEYPVLATDAFSYKNQISLKEYSGNFVGYLRILADAGIDRDKMFKYMPPFCTTRADNSMVIGPGGDIYKCWEHIGHQEYVVGNTKTGISKLKEDEWKVVGSHYYHKKCVDCKLLPVCLGGCPLNWAKYKTEPDCPFFAEPGMFWNILKYTNGVSN